MSTQPNVVLFLVATLVCGVVYIAGKEFQFNQQITRQKSFFTGSQEGQNKKFLFWLPLFLRRRRRTNGKKLANVKHMRQL
jgi:hypothetical protein